MLYKMRNLLSTTAFALVIVFATSGTAMAQGTISLNDGSAPSLNDPAIPDEISLDDNETDHLDGLLTPPSDLSPDQDNFDVSIPLDNGVPAPQPQDQGIQLSQPAEIPTVGSQLQPAPLGLPGAGPLGASTLAPAPEPVNNFGSEILSKAESELFNQMSDIEKQTSLLNLELRREKVKNEIEALKAQRLKAQEEIKQKEEEKERKRIEWEKEQERKLLIEEQKLRELNIQYERLRQESILKAYKEQLLQENQNWVNNNELLYGQIMKVEEERDSLVKNFKMKLNHLSQLAEKAAETAETAKKNYTRELANLQTQISILKSRLEAEKTAREQDQNGTGTKDKANPFASISDDGEEGEKKTVKLSDEYAIMEISGKGNSLAAKLINKDGNSFLVQNGTALRSGHIVDEISQTYVRADKNGVKDYLYFAAGGILDREPIKAAVTGMNVLAPNGIPGDGQPLPLPNTLGTSQGLPSLRDGMFIR